MERPVIFALDDDPPVVRAVARDLRQAYGEDYRIVRSESPTEALDALATLKRQNAQVALFVVDQRMPQMSGVEFLERAVELFPDARKVLLTAYADTDAAIRAINKVRLDYYLMKPWDPPEQKLYPVLDEVLSDWQSAYRTPFEGVVLIDHRWSPSGHQLRDFMARNQIPYHWLDIEKSKEAQDLLGLS
jgi:thioredoxin reductase (NADPH)